jgi:hypothetical protein
MKVRLNGSNLSTVNFYLYYGYKNGLLEYLGFVTNFEIQSKGENRFFFTEYLFTRSSERCFNKQIFIIFLKL